MPAAASRKERGFARHARNTLNTLSLWSDDYLGTIGAGGTDYLPRTITASQSGTTVTASTSVFIKIYVGTRIMWASGEEAVITAVTTAGSGVTTCTVDRSQTVASGTATIRPKHLIGVTYGDSVGNRISPVLQKLMYRTLGFGGYVFQANNVEGNFGSQIASSNVAGGTTEPSGTPDYADFPWGARWVIPLAGSLTVSILNSFVSGAQRPLRHGLEPRERKHDTFVLVWKRAAGAFTVERKRFWDVTWTTVATVADASVGSRVFNFAKYTHTLGSDWEYRVTSTSGTIEVPLCILRNDTVAGYVHWPLSRGGDLINNFDSLPSASLAELCQIVGQPDFRTIFAYDASFGTTVPAPFRADLDTDRALWAAAVPTMDHIWFTGWEADTNLRSQQAWNIAIQEIAYDNDDSLVPLNALFGDFTTVGSRIGWLEDGVHPSVKGELILAHQFLQELGIAEHPVIREGRDVNARLGDFATLRLLGDDVGDRLRKAERRVARDKGARWNYGVGPALVGATGGAIGTSDFTILVELRVLPSANQLYIANAGVSGYTLVQNGGVNVIQNGAQLEIVLRDASGNAIIYRYSQFGTIFSGKTGTLVIRSDVANTRFDLFWDGDTVPGLEGAILGTTTSPLGVWSGTGSEFGIPQGPGSGADRQTDIFGTMFWRQQLSDAEIKAVSFGTAPQTTTPDFWWDFAEGIGRTTHDRSGNGRDAIWVASNPNQYSIGTGPIWLRPARGTLGRPWAATLNATTVLLPGDQIIAKYSAGRDLLLPAVAAVGDTIRVVKATNQTIRITQPALHQILTGLGGTIGTNATTIGTGGRIQFGGNYDSATLICTRAEAGVAYEWTLLDQTGAALTWT
jgi:hypothetical protein